MSFCYFCSLTLAGVMMSSTLYWVAWSLRLLALCGGLLLVGKLLRDEFVRWRTGESPSLVRWWRSTGIPRRVTRIATVTLVLAGGYAGHDIQQHVAGDTYKAGYRDSQKDLERIRYTYTDVAVVARHDATHF